MQHKHAESSNRRPGLDQQRLDSIVYHFNELLGDLVIEQGSTHSFQSIQLGIESFFGDTRLVPGHASERELATIARESNEEIRINFYTPAAWMIALEIWLPIAATVRLTLAHDLFSPGETRLLEESAGEVILLGRLADNRSISITSMSVSTDQLKEMRFRSLRLINL